MKKHLFYMVALLSFFSHAQTALYNNGNIRIHENGKIGLHTNLINNSPFDQNKGLLGFYGSSLLAVSGSVVPLFHDIEIVNPNGVFLDTGIDNENNTTFVLGDFVTSKTNSNNTLNFAQNAFYTGESNSSKVDGYAVITNQREFNFPVGDSEQLRPLFLRSESENLVAKCAYFYENPNNPTSLNNSYNTSSKAEGIATVNTNEFWKLEGNINSSVTINWNNRSGMSTLTDDVNKIIVTGWSNSLNLWINLGNSSSSGNLSFGSITSGVFNPNDVETVTFGILDTENEIISIANHLVTANGDGVNDVLVIDELEMSSNSLLSIYDRYGFKVYEEANYTNGFEGYPNVSNITINKEKGLPSGVYFYTIAMYDLNLDFQGFLYLTR